MAESITPSVAKSAMNYQTIITIRISSWIGYSCLVENLPSKWEILSHKFEILRITYKFTAIKAELITPTKTVKSSKLITNF